MPTASPNLIGRLAQIYCETVNLNQRATLKEAMRLIDPVDERTLLVDELEAKYTVGTGWASHPDFERGEWRQEVVDENTQCGYWEWVFNKVQSAEEQP